MAVDRLEIGGTTDEFGKTIEQFVKYCENVDKKLSVQTAKIILRKTIRESNQALKQATRVTWKKHTGDAVKSVTMKVAKSKSRPGVIYATYGWRGKRKRKKAGDTRKGRVFSPPPATYIGIWNDLGTADIQGKHIFAQQWNIQKERIKKTITDSIQEIIKKDLLNKLH